MMMSKTHPTGAVMDLAVNKLSIKNLLLRSTNCKKIVMEITQ